MICSDPLKVQVGYSVEPAVAGDRAAVPCGKCINCRINQKKVWRNRILLESLCHGDSVFVTLTYDEDHIPDPAHVSKRDLKLFIKRLRNQVKPNKFRYFGVGEYGDSSFRPHYHIILFGISQLQRNDIVRCWKFCNPRYGMSIDEVNERTANYIAGYVTKKILKDEGRHPVNYDKPDEFMICSKGQKKNSLYRGGIGSPAVDRIIAKMKNSKEFETQFLKFIRYGSKKMALGRYLKAKLNDWQDISFTDKLVKFSAQQMNWYLVRHKKVFLGGNYDRKTRL